MIELNVGNNFHGFEVISKNQVPDYRAEGILLRHKSGFEVYALLNDDSECFFNYTIYTPPQNDSGVFHILEHTLLTGSERYPVRDPFMTMVRNSCNTFLNAMTGPDRTYFPAASPVKKDFDNIFNVYTDALFSPLLRKESFMQEGIRLSNRGGMHFEGVVFSEMQGDISQHDSVVANASTRPLFDIDSAYRHEFGGNPPDICDLSYEEFVDTYKKHYVPANMTLFFYGDVDLDKKLAFLDKEYLSTRDYGEKAKRVEKTTSWTKPSFYRTTSNADDDNLSSTVMLSWLLDGCEDPEANTTLALIVDLLLGSPGSPLYKAIIDSGLCRDLSSESGMSDSYRNLLFAVGMDGAKEEDAKKIENYILESLKSIATNGLDPIEIEASLRRKEFRLKEIPSGMPQGYTLFFSRIDKGWAYGKNPSDMLSSSKDIKRIREELKNNPRFFESWIENNLIDNPHRLLSVVVMDSNTQEEMNKAIAKKVEMHSAEYSEEEESAFHIFEAGTDTIDNINRLPRLTSADIPNLSLDYTHSVDGNLITTAFPSGGIVYADVAFDVTDFSYEELEDLSLLSRLLLMTNVGELDYSAFLTQLRFTTGDISISLEAGSTEDGEEKVFLLARFKSLFEHYKEALVLFFDLISKADVHSLVRIKAALSDMDSDFQSSVSRAGHQYVFGSASSHLSSALYTNERTMGLSYWFRVCEMLKNEIECLPERLDKIYRKTFVKDRILFHLSADDDNLDASISSTNGFLSSLPDGKIGESRRSFESKNILCAYTFSTPVNYIGYAFKAADQDSLNGSAEKMLLSIVSKNDLWARIREKGGAYGAGASTDSVESFSFFYTYRDPRIDGSIEDFALAVENEELTEAKLEDGRLAVLSRDVRPVGPSTKALIDFRRYLYRISDEKRHSRKDMLLSLTLSDLEASRKSLVSRIRGDASITVLSDQKSVKTSKFDFDIKSLPFK